jgi:hypothetical protein
MECDDASLKTIAFHRLQQARREHCAGRAAFYVDHVGVQTEVLRDCNRYRREGLVDLNALDICGFPAGAVEHLLRSELAGSLSCVSVILIMRTGGA